MPNPCVAVLLLRWEILEVSENGEFGQNCFGAGKEILQISGENSEDCQKKLKKWMEQIKNSPNSISGAPIAESH